MTLEDGVFDEAMRFFAQRLGVDGLLGVWIDSGAARTNDSAEEEVDEARLSRDKDADSGSGSDKLDEAFQSAGSLEGREKLFGFDEIAGGNVGHF